MDVMVEHSGKGNSDSKKVSGARSLGIREGGLAKGTGFSEHHDLSLYICADS